VRTRRTHRLAGLLASVIALLLVATAPASAAYIEYEWTRTLQTLNPTIRQTNLWYTSAVMAPSTPPSSTGVIVQTYHQWRLRDGPGTRGTLVAQACTTDLSRCTDITFTPSYTTYQGYPAYVSSGYTTYFAGLPANTEFVYRYRLNAPTTQVLAAPIESSMHRISVNWTEG